ncbi:hypothetical protein BGW80DRAFT_1442307 [Lactifluus volemus]|nr:hypothetical protein BGW80DRAFT_1442307 [Lactifluus volemus]
MIVLFIVPFLFLVCTLVATIVSAIYMYDSYITNLVRDANMGQAFAVVTWGLTVGTNLWATSLMFIRAWQHRRFLRSVLDEETTKSKAEKTLAFLVESGAIYLCAWVAYITITACGVDWAIILDRGLVQLLRVPPLFDAYSVHAPVSNLQISEAGLNDSDTENGRKMTTRQDL